MAKIILTMNNKVLREIVLSKERMTIGRGPHNDIVIDNLAVSAEHAAIVTVNEGSFLEDLNSTNGTQVNGQPVRRHFLQDKDVIELAQYRIRYIANVDDQHLGCAQETSVRAPESVYAAADIGRIKVLNGAKAGHETILTKALTTVGRFGVQVAVFTQQENGYYIRHVEGGSYPIINGAPIKADTQVLNHGDVVELAGARLQFSLK